VQVDNRDKPDPRSPVQPDKSNATYFLLALIAAVALWTIQQARTQDSLPPVEHPTDQTEPRLAQGDLRTVFSADDYPADAQQNGDEGTAQARLTVDTSGHVSACAIIRSSGHPSLDAATCRILQTRARFRPARDEYGRPVPDTVVTPPVTWRLAD